MIQKVVLDTNVLLVALPTRSPYRVIFDRLLAAAFEFASYLFVLEIVDQPLVFDQSEQWV